MDTKTFVRQARKQLGLSQGQLGKLLGISACNVSNYEIGRAVPPGNIVLEIQSLVEKIEKKRVGK